MRFGIHSGLWMARWTDEVAPILKTVTELGFDGVEISLLGMDDERARTLGQLIRDYGLLVTCSDGLSRAADITSDDPNIRQHGSQHLRWAIRTAATMGAERLAGVVYAPWGVFDSERKSVRAALAAEALGQLDGDLADNGITLGIEAINRFETDLINNSAEAVALALASGSSQIGVLLDTFHMNIEEKNIYSAINGAGEKLAHFHVSDNDRGVPGSGHLPWEQVSRGLSDARYQGWVVAEMFVVAGNPTSIDLNIWRHIEPDATRAAREALAFMKATFR